MELIINQLSEIEAASVKIIEHATEQKKEISEHFKQLTRDFDEQVDLDTQKRLSDLNIKLTKEKEEELAKLRDDTEKLMSALDKAYEDHHTELAKYVVDQIIKE